MPVIITAVLGVVGNFFSSLFNFKGEQAKTLQSSIDLLGSVDDNASKSTVALAQAMASILTQGSILERNWRAVLMCACVGIILCSYFGYVPPHFNDPFLTPMMSEIFRLVEIGLGGYIAKTGIVEVFKVMGVASIIKDFIAKKIW